MPTLARHAYATFALSAKLHKLLDQMGVEHRQTQEQVNFDSKLDNALLELERSDSSLHVEAKSVELTMLKKDFTLLERFYDEYKHAEALPETVSERFDRIFKELKEKIKEKELAI
jgi:pyruvate/2-oxoacid:ferredoxin oxidoreductase alpha subunit